METKKHNTNVVRVLNSRLRGLSGQVHRDLLSAMVYGLTCCPSFFMYSQAKRFGSNVNEKRKTRISSCQGKINQGNREHGLGKGSSLNPWISASTAPSHSVTLPTSLVATAPRAVPDPEQGQPRWLLTLGTPKIRQSTLEIKVICWLFLFLFAIL